MHGLYHVLSSSTHPDSIWMQTIQNPDTDSYQDKVKGKFKFCAADKIRYSWSRKDWYLFASRTGSCPPVHKDSIMCTVVSTLDCIKYNPFYLASVCSSVNQSDWKNSDAVKAQIAAFTKSSYVDWPPSSRIDVKCITSTYLEVVLVPVICGIRICNFEHSYNWNLLFAT